MRLIMLSIAFAGIAGMSACNNAEQKETVKDSVAADNTLPPPPSTPEERAAALAGCYSVIHGRDTSSLQLDVRGSAVTGPLSYMLYEKDKNTGTIQAEIKDDLLTGWYFFKSEGIMSVRQVIWKIHGADLWPGMGEMKSNKDTLSFVNPNNLQFDTTHPFKKVPCML